MTDSDDLSWQDEEMDMAEKAEEEEEEKRFPNEVKAPPDEPARIRFQHYRSPSLTLFHRPHIT